MPETVKLIQQHVQTVQPYATPVARLVQQHVQTVQPYATPVARLVQQHVQVVRSTTGTPSNYRMFLVM
jgi:phage-related protein